MTQTTDWRGVPMKVGDIVIYGSTAGSGSTAMTEAEVVDIKVNTRTYHNGLTEHHTRVKVRIIRRSGSGSQKFITLDGKNLTVVNGLPDATTETQDDIQAAAKVREDRHKRHNFPDDWWRTPNVRCGLCGVTWKESYESECF